MTERAKFKGVANFVIKQDNKFLLLFRTDGCFNYNGGTWVFPAGHIEYDETATDATIRELKEELDITVLPKDVKFVHVISNLAGRTQGFDFFFSVNKYTGVIRNCETEHCEKIGFFTIPEINRLGNVAPTTKQVLNMMQRHIKYSECRSY